MAEPSIWDLIKERRAQMFAEYDAALDAVEYLLPTMRGNGRGPCDPPKVVYDGSRRDHQMARRMILGMVGIDIDPEGREFGALAAMLPKSSPPATL